MGGCLGVEEVPINSLKVDESHFTILKLVDRGGFGKVNAVIRRIDNKVLAMKRIPKASLVGDRPALRRVLRERDYMIRFDSPFVMRLFYVYQNSAEICFVMPFMSGGSLAFHLHKYLYRGFPEDWCRFYAAECLLGIEHIHSLDIISRDVKPANLLLDAEGHAKLSDFGLARDLTVEEKGVVKGRAGTEAYMAPEVLADKEYAKSCDIYSFGATIYDMLHGTPPFSNKVSSDISAKYSDPRGAIIFSTTISTVARDLLELLMDPDPTTRLGCGPGGIADIKRHDWFKEIDWVALAKKELVPPFVPSSKNLGAENFENLAALNEMLMNEKPVPVKDEHQSMFIEIDYNTDPRKVNPTQVELDPELFELTLKKPAEAALMSPKHDPADERKEPWEKVAEHPEEGFTRI